MPRSLQPIFGIKGTLVPLFCRGHDAPAGYENFGKSKMY